MDTLFFFFFFFIGTGLTNRLVERDAYTNELFPYKKCMRCPFKSVVLAPLQNPYVCQACPHQNMTYNSKTLTW